MPRTTSSTIDLTAAQEEVTPRRSASTVDLIIDATLPVAVQDEATPQVSPPTIEFTFEVPVPVAALHADGSLGLSFFDCAGGDTALRIRYVESPGFIDAYNHLRVNSPDNIAVQTRCAT